MQTTLLSDMHRAGRHMQPVRPALQQQQQFRLCFICMYISCVTSQNGSCFQALYTTAYKQPCWLTQGICSSACSTSHHTLSVGRCQCGRKPADAAVWLQGHRCTAHGSSYEPAITTPALRPPSDVLLHSSRQRLHLHMHTRHSRQPEPLSTCGQTG
jgi:hypothetical protein